MYKQERAKLESFDIKLIEILDIPISLESNLITPPCSSRDIFDPLDGTTISSTLLRKLTYTHFSQ